MITRDETVLLIEELLEAADAYYNSLGEALISDEEYDSKLEVLSTLVDVYPELFEEGEIGFSLLDNEVAAGTVVPAGRDTVKHDNLMMSLAKAKTEKELLAWVNRVKKEGTTDYVLQCKLDGLAISLKYVDGKLIQASTRGDGETGENVSYIFTTDHLSIIGIPETISEAGKIEVRGELFLTDQQFVDLDSARSVAFPKLDKFKNSRNALVGTLKKAKFGLEYDAKLTFGAYSLWKDAELIDLDKVSEYGDFITVNDLTVDRVGDLKLTGFTDFNDLFDSIHKFGELRKSFDIPTDGVVIKPVNEAEMFTKMGVNSHHPLSQIAYKYPGNKAITTVIGIDITVGKTGKLTPVARLTPVDLDGVTISNISLHNFSIIHELGVTVGSTVYVVRSNQVIPQVESVILTPENAVAIEVPSVCPECGTELWFEDDEIWPPKTIRCLNNVCPSRMYYGVKTAVGKNLLDIDGLSEVMLTELHSTGRVNDISDLYTLTINELANTYAGDEGEKRRFGEKRAKHVVDYIEKSKTKPLYKLLASLNVTGLGPTMSKKLVAHFGTLEKILEASRTEIATLDDFGDKRAEEIVSGLLLRKELIEKLKNNGVVFDSDSSNVQKTSENPVFGKSFAISGPVPKPFANRNAWVDFIEENGGSFHSTPKDNTDYMVADVNGSSSKIKSAISKGLTFITDEEFTSNFVNS